MDELSKRVLFLMEGLSSSRSEFANSLDISLASLTHISSGRNKPSLDLVQKILFKYPFINPDWLIHGNGDYKREVIKKQSFEEEIVELEHLKTEIEAALLSIEQIAAYHKLLIDEVLHLKELSKNLDNEKIRMENVKLKLEVLKSSIISKV